MKALKGSKLFGELQNEYLEKIIDTFKIKRVSENDKVFSKDDKCKNNICFVIEGQYELSVKEGRADMYGHDCMSDKTD